MKYGRRLLILVMIMAFSSCGNHVIYGQKTLFSEMGLESVAKPLRIELPVNTVDANLKVIRPGYEVPATATQIEVWKDVPTVLFLYRFDSVDSDTGRLLGATYHSPGEAEVVISEQSTALWLITLPGYLNPSALGFEDLAEFRAWAAAHPRFPDLVRAVEGAVESEQDILDDTVIQTLVQEIWQSLEGQQGLHRMGSPQDFFALKWQDDDFFIEAYRGTPLGVAVMGASEEGGINTSFVRAALLFDRSIFGEESRTLTHLLSTGESIVCVGGIDLGSAYSAYRDLVELSPGEYSYALERSEAEAVVAARLPFMAELLVSSVAFLPAYGDAISMGGDAVYTIVETFGEDLEEMVMSYGQFLVDEGGRVTLDGTVRWLEEEFRTRQRAQSLARKLAKMFTGDARRTRTATPFISFSKKALEFAGKVFVVGDGLNLYSLIKDSNGPAGCYLVDSQKKTVQEIQGPKVDVVPDGIDDGEVNVEYTFSVSVRFLREANFPLELDWTFGDGANGGTTVESGGSPFVTEIVHAYSEPGAYGLTVSVRPNTGSSASRSVHVFIGERTERDYDLNICDTWEAANSGGAGIYLDSWDISAIPEGAVFDIAFNTYCMPDKIVVRDPIGQDVLDTGWRGCAEYDGDPNYPGGIAGPGEGFVADIFQKHEGESNFQVIVVGGEPGTAWDYQVRCRIPTGEGAAVMSWSDPALEQLFSRQRYEGRSRSRR